MGSGPASPGFVARSGSGTLNSPSPTRWIQNREDGHQRTVQHIAAIRLDSAPIVEMQRFYARTLGLPVLGSSPDGFAVRAGATTLAFRSAPRTAAAPDGGPSYHFAFNIPSDQIESACRWLHARVPVLRGDDRREIVRFDSWNASAVYFHDPAGNIVEFIARHDLAHRTDGDFHIDGLLSVSEIGIAVPESLGVLRAAERLSRTLGLHPYRPISDDFAALGTEQGLLILVPAGRPWFMSPDRTARLQPTTLELVGEMEASCHFSDFPVSISMSKH